MTADDLKAGDKVVFKKDGAYLEGVIKSITGDSIEIDDSTIRTVCYDR